MLNELVLASRNSHKVAELSALLAPYDLVELPEGVRLPPETGTTFKENALIKARAAAAAVERPVVADDSGISVAALNGAPGVLSARWAGESATDRENLEKLLNELSGEPDRRAAYVCVLALVDPTASSPEPLEVVVEARCEGTIAQAPHGNGGFGYDPAFVAREYSSSGLTMAEISQDEKDAISHRGIAARKLREQLDRLR